MLENMPDVLRILIYEYALPIEKFNEVLYQLKLERVIQNSLDYIDDIPDRNLTPCMVGLPFDNKCNSIDILDHLVGIDIWNEHQG